ncbi:MAG: L-threonylcarbamoyladenylate synthase [Candidatus Bathyarchaeia archaeon]
MLGKSRRNRRNLDASVRKAAEAVRRGGLVVFPTDTVYGLGCDPFDEAAVRKLLKLKWRRSKPLPILVSSLAKAQELAYFSEAALKLAKRNWPGPLTMVLPTRRNISDVVSAGANTVGLRMPNSPTALKLIKLCGGALIGTSANKAGGMPPRTAQQAIKALGPGVDSVIDGGPTRLGVSSAVVEVHGDDVRVLRKGPVEKLRS